VIWQTGHLIFLGLGGLNADILGIRAVYLLGGTLPLIRRLHWPGRVASCQTLPPQPLN